MTVLQHATSGKKIKKLPTYCVLQRLLWNTQAHLLARCVSFINWVFLSCTFKCKLWIITWIEVAPNQTKILRNMPAGM